jgi:hypothetical protein
MNQSRFCAYRHRLRLASELEVYIHLKRAVHVNDQTRSSLREKTRKIGIEIVLPHRKSWN